MSKYHGHIGYAIDNEVSPGVWDETIIEHEYYGEIIKNRVNVQSGNNINPGISLTINLSIIGDPYAYEHFYSIRYVTYLGKKWSVTNIDPGHPRIVISLGGLYNG